MTIETDLEEECDELNTLFWEIEYDLRNIDRLGTSNRARKCKTLKDNCESASKRLKSLQYHVVLLESHNQSKSEFEKKAEAFSVKLKQYKPLVDNLDLDAKASPLDEEPSVTASNGSPRSLPSDQPTSSVSFLQQPEDASGITKKTVQLQDDAFTRLNRTQKTIEETIDVGQNTNYMLRGQGDHLRNLMPKLDKTETFMREANRKTRKILRMLAVDRVTLVLVILIIIVAGAIILLISLDSSKSISLPVRFSDHFAPGHQPSSNVPLPNPSLINNPVGTLKPKGNPGISNNLAPDK